mmetsp:Transcript_5823/g.8940  ORF Transcript_5823/g.8940 Transcript_5823/m.8940 type:complete len:101 (+) Transcript_5823:421-723(+)
MDKMANYDLQELKKVKEAVKRSTGMHIWATILAAISEGFWKGEAINRQDDDPKNSGEQFACRDKGNQTNRWEPNDDGVKWSWDPPNLSKGSEWYQECVPT